MKLPSFLTGIMITIAVFISLLVTVVIFSFYQDVNLVTPEYYSDELAYQTAIDNIRRTRTLESDLSISVQPAQGIVILVPKTLDHHNLSGRIQVYRPSDHRLDQWVDFNPVSGQQIIRVNEMVPGLWMVKIFWVMDGDHYYTESDVVLD